MYNYLKLFVYKLMRHLALWTGRFYTIEEHRRLLTKDAERWRAILLDEKETKWFRLCYQATIGHKEEMEKAIMFGISPDRLKQLEHENL